MNNKSFNVTMAISTFAAATFLCLSAATAMAAGPGSAPTGGNVDAKFNSVMLTDDGSSGLLLAPTFGGMQNTKIDSACDLNALINGGPASAVDCPLSIDDYLFVNGDTNPLALLALTNASSGIGIAGISTNTTAGLGGYFQGNIGIQAIRDGATGAAARFEDAPSGTISEVKVLDGGSGIGIEVDTGNSYTKGIDVSSTRAGSTAGTFVGNLVGVSGTGNGAGGYGVSGSSSGDNGKGVVGSTTGNFSAGVFGYVTGAGATNSTGVTGQVFVGAPASAQAGSFVNASSSLSAKLGTNTDALAAWGPSDMWGAIRNSSLTNGGEVRVEDTQGFTVTVPTAPVRFKVDGSTGAVSNPTATEPSKVIDAEGLSVSSGTWNLNTSLDLQGRLYNNSGTIYSGVVGIDDPDGFGIFSSYPGYTSAPHFKISASGDIGHPGLVCGNPPTCSFWVNTELKVTDDEGLLIANNAGTASVAAKSTLGNYKSSADFTGAFQFGPSATPSMLTDFNSSGGLATNGAVYSSGVLIKNPASGLSVDSDAGGLTVTTKTGGATIYATGPGGGLTVNTASGGLTVSKINGTFLGQPMANIDSATGNITGVGSIATTDGTNFSGLYNNGWIAAYGGYIYSAATDWSNYVLIAPNGNIDATGHMTARNITSSGHIKASSGIGSIYSVSDSTPGSCTGALCMAFSTASCGSDTVLSCNFSVNSNGAPMYSYFIGNVCYLGAKNWAGGGTLTATSYAQCFNPNG